jgi:hypothetical protein
MGRPGRLRRGEWEVLIELAMSGTKRLNSVEGNREERLGGMGREAEVVSMDYGRWGQGAYQAGHTSYASMLQATEGVAGVLKC